MSISSEITRISDNVSGALDAIESKGVTIPTGANSDDLPSLISSIKTGSSVVVTPTLLTGTDIASISVDGSSTTLYAPTPPTPSSATPQDLGTASSGSSTDYSRADHVHAKPSYSKSDVGLGNVDNVQQYSASNPPPYPVTSVNGETGEVTLTASDVNAIPAPASASSDNVLAYNGSAWVADKRTVILSYGHSTWAEFLSAYNANAVVYCRASSNANPASGSQTRMAFMAYVNNADNPTNVEFQYYRSVSSHSASQQGDQVYVYKLDKNAGWTVTVRENYTKIVAGSGLSSAYSSGTLTLSSTVSVPTASDATPENLGTAAAGSSANYSRADHVHAMPTASDVGALPSSTVIPSAATATPANLGTAAVGTSSKYAKEDHVHNYPDVVHVGSTAPTNTNIELWLDSSSGGNSVVSSVDGKTGTVTVLPSGGTAGQVLKKVSGTSYDVTWANESGSVTSVNGQTGDVTVSTIAVQDNAPSGGELVWIDTDEPGESITIPQIDDNNVSAADTWSSQKIRDFIYPVGSIYMSVNATSPATIFGGTWEQIEDTFLLAAGTNYTAGATGGEAAHTLSATEIPAHTHGRKSLTGSLYRAVLDDGDSITRSGIVSSIDSPRTSTWKSEGGTACYRVNFDASHEHDSVGGGGAHNNMPPYLAVYMWKRTA